MYRFVLKHHATGMLETAHSDTLSGAKRSLGGHDPIASWKAWECWEGSEPLWYCTDDGETHDGARPPPQGPAEIAARAAGWTRRDTAVEGYYHFFKSGQRTVFKPAADESTWEWICGYDGINYPVTPEALAAQIAADVHRTAPNKPLPDGLEYAFDCLLSVAIRVPNARDERHARALLHDHAQQADANFGAWPNGDPITAEVTLADDIQTPRLYEVAGEPVDNAHAPGAILTDALTLLRATRDDTRADDDGETVALLFAKCHWDAIEALLTRAKESGL